MSESLGMVCGFLGGTIIAVESGYKVFPHPKPEKIYNRLSDAKWFLALRWCDALPTAAGIINNTGELSFFNQKVFSMGEDKFVPHKYRSEIFTLCLGLKPNETITYQLPSEHQSNLTVQALEIDPRYSKVALIQKKQYLK